MYFNATLDRRTLLNLGGAAALGGGAAMARPRLGWAATDSLPVVNTVNAGGTSLDTVPVLQELARRLGYLKEFGVTTEEVNVSSTSLIVASIVGGQEDACMYAGVGAVFPAIEKGADLKVIGAVIQHLAYAMVTANPNIKSAHDLVGKTIGVGPLGSLLHEISMAWLATLGVDARQVKFVNVGSSPDVFRAVMAKTVDAGPASSLEFPLLEQFDGHQLSDGKMWEVLPNFVFHGAFASAKAIAEKREALVRLVAAYAKVYRFMSTPESETTFVKTGTDMFGEKTRPELESEWKFYNGTSVLATNPIMKRSAIARLQKLNVELGAQKAVLPFDKVADMSIAKDAVKLLAGV